MMRLFHGFCFFPRKVLLPDLLRLTLYCAAGLWWLGMPCSLLNAASAESSSQEAEKSAEVQVPPEKRVALLRSWQRKMASSGDLELHWQQSQYKALRKRWHKSSGKGYFQAPHRFRWDMHSLKQSWIFDGQRLIHIDEQKKQGLPYAISGAQGKEFLRFISLITQFEDLQKEYRIEKLTESSELLKLTLKPYQNHELSRVQVNYFKKQAVIRDIRMNFVSGNHTTLSFSAHERRTLPKTTFTLPVGIALQKPP